LSFCDVLDWAFAVARVARAYLRKPENDEAGRIVSQKLICQQSKTVFSAST
jgi:hypothetical protein